ncbi:Thiamine-monophosphate kinase [Candidatus Calditenuaceae archaeon HR02]|nr:Thiamine-monophosphate kinase [Candidatus Calditenuaceae archaeon HR02]
MIEELDRKALEELGEDWIISMILKSLKPIEKGRLQIGDDAVELSINGQIVVSGDMLVASTDVPPGMTHYQIGSKAVVSVVSDFAAKAAQPLFFVIELGLPKEMRGNEFLELWSGILEAGRAYGGEVVAGDTNQAREILVGVVGIGYSEAPIPRRGARPGDILAVTGEFGKTYTGLHAAFNSNTEEKWRPLLDAVFNPKPRIREGLAIGKAKLATASIDSSDGLEACLFELSQWSGVGFRVTDPPIDPLAAEYAAAYSLDIFEAIFRGGEEYELVLTIPRDSFDDALAVLRGLGCRLIPIGEATREKSIVAWLEGKRYELSGRGWRHFSSRRI